MELTELYMDDLPPSMRLMAEIIGLSKTLELFREFGGSRIYFPKQGLRCDHPARELLSDADCIVLSKYFLGTMNVPRAEMAIVAARNRQIWRDNEHGLTLRQLRLKYDLCERQVNNSIASQELRLQNLSNSLPG